MMAIDRVEAAFVAVLIKGEYSLKPAVEDLLDDGRLIALLQALRSAEPGVPFPVDETTFRAVFEDPALAALPESPEELDGLYDSLGKRLALRQCDKTLSQIRRELERPDLEPDRIVTLRAAYEEGLQRRRQVLARAAFRPGVWPS